MDKSNITRAFKAIKSGVTKHSPEILTGIGIAGMLTTVGLAVKATPKAMQLIEEAEREKYNEHNNDGGFSTGREPLTKIETVKVAWKPYVPAAVTCATSVGCLIGGSRVSAKRNAALATAYQLSTKALNDFKEKAVEVVGEEKTKEIRDKVVEEKKERIANSGSTIVISGEEDILMYETFSNQEFRSTSNKVDKVVNELNRRMITGSEDSISLNEFLHELDLKPNPRGDEVGWNPSFPIDLAYDADMNDHDKPRLTISYITPPFYDYRNYYS